MPIFAARTIKTENGLLSKNKYRREEVEEILAKVKTEYDETIGELKEKAEILSKENRDLSVKVERYERDNTLISSSIKSAEKKAAEIVSAAENRYLLELSELNAFCERFKNYFSYLIEKYPHYGKVKESKTDFDKIKKIIDGNATVKEKIKSADKVVKKRNAAPFNPQDKINEYIAGTGENGFNLDEVLNPGELHLEELCKELGLTEEE